MGLKKLLLSFIVTFIAFSATAQKIGGAEIYYRKIGVDKYLVTAHVYRICSEAPLNNLTMFAKADSFNIGMSMKRIHIEKIPDTCGNPCNLQNQASNFGFEKHTFIDTVDFNKAPYKLIQQANLCEVRFAIHQKIRHLPSNATYTFGDSMFYLDAMINRCNNFSSYNSPEFSIEPKFSYQANVQNRYSPGPIDSIDFDSLSFELAPAQNNNQSSVSYITPFTYNIPLNSFCGPNPSVINCKPIPDSKPPRGFYFDYITCTSIFTPTVINQKSTLKYIMKEWRKNSMGVFEMIGYVSREMCVLIVEPNPNNWPAYFTGGFQYSVCQKNQVCFNLYAKDDPFSLNQPILDTVTVDWDHGIPMGTMKLQDSNSREKNMNFCWKTKTTDKPSHYFFTAKAFDLACNANLTSKTFITQLKPSVLFSKTSSMDSCNVITYNLIPFDTSFYNVPVVQVLDSKKKEYYYSFKWNDKITLNKNDTFIIKYWVNNPQFNCPIFLYDTFVSKNAFERGFQVNNQDTNVCYTYPAQLSFTPSLIKKLVQYEWYINDSNTLHKDSIFQLAINQKCKIALRLTDHRGCQSESYRNFIPFQVNNNPFSNTKLFTCKMDSITLTANLNNIQSPYTSTWKFKNFDTTFNGNTLKILPDANFKIAIKLKDHRHCRSLDSIAIVKNSNLEDLLPDKNIACLDSIVHLTAKVASNYSLDTFNWLIDGKAIFHNSLQLDLKINSNHWVIFKSTNQFNCTFSDSVYIQSVKNPIATFSAIDYQLCPNDSLSLFANLFRFDSEIDWFFKNKNLNNNSPALHFLPDTSGSLKLKINNLKLCYLEKSIPVTKFPQSQIKIITDTFYNQYHQIYVRVIQNLKEYKWFNGDKTFNSSFWAYELGAPGKHKIWINCKDQNNCDVSDTVDIYTDRFVDINKLNNGIFKIYPNPSNGTFFIDSDISETMVVYDLNGKKVFEKALSIGQNTIHLESLNSGVYNIQIGNYKTSIAISK